MKRVNELVKRLEAIADEINEIMIDNGFSKAIEVGSMDYPNNIAERLDYALFSVSRALDNLEDIQKEVAPQ